MDLPLVTRRSEPIFNVPAVVIALIGVFVFVYVAQTFVLTPDENEQFLEAFAFIPARYHDSAVLTEDVLPGGWAANVWTFITYAFIHANVPHLVLNAVWFLPFGSAVARRFGSARFLLLFVVTAAAGAGAHLLTNDAPMVGASAAISGCMGAATRFAFQRGGPLGLIRGGDEESYRVPAAPLLVALRDIRIIVFLAAWFAVNIVFGLGSIGMPGVEEAIAWQAHIGGFLAGLLLFALFDPVVVPSEPEQHEPHNGEQSQDPTLQ